MRKREPLALVIVAVGYVAFIEWIASVASTQLGVVQPHEWLRNAVETQPPLMRWDSFWYERIATEGYHLRPVLDGQTNVGFLPLYAWLARFVTMVTGLDYPRASLWIARVFFLGSLPLLFHYARERGHDPWRVITLLLCFPSAFILVSSYTESLYLLCCIGALVSARHRQWELATILTGLAALTRITGVVLVPVMLGLAIEQWRAGSRSWRAFLPMLGPILAHIGLGLYFNYLFGDFFAYMHAKAAWGATLTWPWSAIRSGIEVLTTPHADVQALLEVGCVVLLVAACVWCARRRLTPEAVLVGGTLLLSLTAGILLSLVRYSLGAFPMFLALERASARPAVWYPLLFCMVCLQMILLVRFVGFVGLPP